MTTVTVTPAEINAQHGKPVLLIDIRSHDEWRREHISGTRSLPLEQLHAGCFSETGLSETDTVIFHCQSGMRTGNAALIMQGGLNAWKAAGYPVIVDRRQPLPLMRQVQIAAGALALGGSLGGLFLTSVLYVIPGFVGAGLMLAGMTGWCGMAKLLAVMPWNREHE